MFGFIDRVHVGACLIANRRLKERIFKLSSTLPVHHLICEFGSEQIVSSLLSGAKFLPTSEERAEGLQELTRDKGIKTHICNDAI